MPMVDLVKLDLITKKKIKMPKLWALSTKLPPLVLLCSTLFLSLK